MRRQGLSSILTVLALSTALVACSDDASDPDEPAPSAAAADAHARTRAFADSAGAELTGPPAPMGLASQFSARAITRSDGIDANAIPGDFGCFPDASPTPVAATAVDCAEPHMSEGFGVLAMDDGSWPDDYEAYAPDTQSGDLWRAWGTRNCDALLQQATGSEALADALGPTGATPYPSGYVNNGFTLPSRAEWAAGDRRTYCMVFTTEDHEAPGNWTPTLMSADRPDSLSSCRAYVDDAYVGVPCSEQHWREEAFYVNATDVLTQAFVDSVDPANVTDDQWATLDEVCARGEEAVVGAARDDVKLYSDVVPGYWGDAPGWYPINCGIVPEDSSQDIVGSAIGVGDGELQLVPTAVPS